MSRLSVGTTGIVILNYNTYDDTIKCINSIKTNETKLKFIIYIVDNASPDKSGKALQLYFQDAKNVKCILSEKNLGFSGGNNLGIKVVLADGCEYVYLLNSDVILHNNAISKMNETLVKNQSVVTVGPRIFNLSRIDTQFAMKPKTYFSLCLCMKPLSLIFRKVSKKINCYNYDHKKDFYFTGAVHGCCFGLRSDFLINNGFLDDSVFMYFEETILSQKIKLNNKEACICSSAIVCHAEQKSTSKSVVAKKVFCRMYSWSSFVYVLGKYCKTPYWICWLHALKFRIVWCCLSMRNIYYRKNRTKFNSEMSRILALLKRNLQNSAL